MPLKKLKLKEEELYDLMTTIGNLLIYNTLGQQLPDFRVFGGQNSSSSLFYLFIFFLSYILSYDFILLNFFYFLS